MFTKKELLEGPEYLLTKYQNEIFRQVKSYMETNNLTQKQLAEKLGVSSAYISQVLNGNFNFTLKKLIELGIMIGKVPSINFISPDKYWQQQKKSEKKTPKKKIAA